MTFSSLNLNAKLVSVLEQAFSTPTEIQTLSLPEAVKNRDIFAMAQTGSGKTLAFGLALIDQAMKDNSTLSSIVLTPTRELASQVGKSIESIASLLEVNTLTLMGGVDKTLQVKQLKQQTPNIIVATPGRLLELISEKALETNTIKSLVLDEADRLLDMGFWPDVNTIVGLLPKKRQTMMFSATFSNELKQKATAMLFQPKRIKAKAKAKQDNVTERINETLYLVNKGSKTKALISRLTQLQAKQALVFVGAKDNADAVCKKLNKAGIVSAALHGDKDQTARQETLAQFKSGEIHTLVATDLLARGVHIDDLPLVINMELPSDAKTYVHRIGRTARAGKNGIVVSLVCHGEQAYLEAIREHTGRSLQLRELEGFPVTDKPASGESKRAPRDKQANRRTNKKSSVKQFKSNKPSRKPAK
ncbi:DEAD/DEAH box helicase [Vibrio astriarenae]|uniref:DEAD/DEAH box helicase n=1 Tax=Vibrio astriarenae TaxID=1481923 RepID=A0A7Z2T7U3_9VIBR|nr:DEAD/DEAH box helicase [Vibrio astriarenae]QIA65862.1 DEAD/DEAH box helicase [Vibrio astriarenae]